MFSAKFLKATAGARFGACVLSASLITASIRCMLRSMSAASFWSCAVPASTEIFLASVVGGLTPVQPERLQTATVRLSFSVDHRTRHRNRGKLQQLLLLGLRIVCFQQT